MTVYTLTPLLLSRLPPPITKPRPRPPSDVAFCATFCHFFLQFATLRKRTCEVKLNDPKFVNRDNDLAGRGKWVCRPDSVGQKPDDHSSWRAFTSQLMPPTHMRNQRWTIDGPSTKAGARMPIWCCSRWGLACQRCRQRRGGLLPHHFTLTYQVETWQAVSFLCHFPSPWVSAARGQPRLAAPGR